jgi:hypothetical protein
MTLQEFVERSLNSSARPVFDYPESPKKRIVGYESNTEAGKWDFDGMYDCQCVDLARFYFRDVLEIPQPKGLPVGARELYEKFESDPVLFRYFTRIPNTPDAVPEAGDVMLWDKNAGSGCGHVAIFLEGNVKTFRSLDQNWTPFKTTIVHHGYSNVLGWLRPKREAI